MNPGAQPWSLHGGDWTLTRAWPSSQGNGPGKRKQKETGREMFRWNPFELAVLVLSRSTPRLFTSWWMCGV